MAIENMLLTVFDDATSGGAGSTPFDAKEFIEKIFPGAPWDVIIQLVALVVLFLIVFFIGYKPIKKMVGKRREYIANEISSAEALHAEAQEAVANKDATIQEGKDEAARIVSEAKAQAEAERSRILAEAEAEAASKRKQADLDIAAAREKSKADVQREIVEVALAASSKLLSREVSSQDNADLVSSFVADLQDKE